MAFYESSIEALKQLLHLGTQDRKASDKNTDVTHCHITKASKDVADGMRILLCGSYMQQWNPIWPTEKKPSNFITKHIGLGIEYDHLHHTKEKKLTAAYEALIGHGAKCIAANIMAAD
jgi:hypothetical protein